MLSARKCCGSVVNVVCIVIGIIVNGRHIDE
jgi:hypothetical protein